MALAKTFSRTVTEIVPATTKVVQVPHIELNLTMEEAQTLLDICTHIGGSMTLSPRKHADAIYAALRSQDVPNAYLATNPLARSIQYENTGTPS